MGRRKKGEAIHGWVNLDKPVGLTSTQALAKVRRLLNAQKAGHAGTLDPLAEGALPIALGEATKTISYAQDHLKTYEFTVTWGEQRDTDDREGQVIRTSEVRPDRKAIEALLPRFTGNIEQTPPRYSAIKIDGERAYDLARDGEEFVMAARSVFVQSIILCEGPAEAEASFTVTCGKGTYVRSLARDMAECLGTCGYVSALKRTAVGPFRLKTAISLDRLAELGNSAALGAGAPDGIVLPLETVLDDIPALAMKGDETAKLRNGQVLSFVSRPDFERLEKAGLDVRHTGLALCKSRPVAIIEIEGPKVKPVRVFNL